MKTNMHNFNPREIDWCFVLNLKELKECITITDKLEISQLNKVCRHKLKPSLFSVIKYGLKSSDLNIFNKELVKGELNLDIIIRDYKAETPQIIQYVLELVIRNYFNIYKLIPISDIFYNLNSISIYNIFIPLNIMYISLDKLKFLNTLKLEKVTLVQFQNYMNNGPLLKLTDSFTSLMLKDCYLIKSRLTADPLRLAYNYDIGAISKNQLYMLDQDFPNLESYSIIGFKSTVSPVLINFLTRHSLINNLTISSNLLTQQTLNFISELSNIEKLTIEDRGIDPALSVPLFPHIRRFQLYFFESQFNYKANEFYKSMNNLKSLTMNYFRNFAEVLSDILEHSPNLKTLKIWNNLHGELELEYITKNQLKYLELFNFRQRSINSQIFTNSPNISKLTIHKSNEKYSVAGIQYVHERASIPSHSHSEILNFKDYSDYLIIYPITNFKPSMINFYLIMLNLY